MEAAEIKPDVVDKLPSDVIKVKYGELTVDMGNELTPSQVKKPPISISWPVQEGAHYTLLMTDPDAPSRQSPKYREWHHWLIVNIPGCDISKGEVKIEYMGAGPPRGTGLHRYIFLAYEQPGAINYTDPVLSNTSGAGRGSRKARALASKFKLGDPVAGNFFQAQHEG